VRSLLFGLVMMGVVGCGTAAKVKRLSAVEKDHYYALRVWMDDAQEKTYLKKKTQVERDAFLKEAGLWDRFYKYSPEERQAILEGDVKVGFKIDQVFMAWGEPHDRTRLPGRQAERSEMLVYRFEVDEEGVIRVWSPDSKTAYKAVDQFRKEVIIDDARVAEIKEKKGW
jgi:hypothetical protein